MIRPFTALCAVLAGASGLYLYTEKHRTTVLDTQISKIVQDTQHIRERTAMLRAEWALLNQPDRLHALSTRFLPDLQPMAPNQFVQMAALSRRLPEVAAAPAAPAEAPAVTSTAAPVDMTVLAPIQIMASRMVPSTRNVPADLPAASRQASPAMRSASSAIASEGARHAVAERGHALSRMAPFKLAGSSRPVPSRPMPQPTMQASRTVVYEGSPLRSLISTQGAYMHPYPMQTAWRTVAQAAAPAPATGSRSSLGFSHAALPAPVPLVGN
jgi:hypothetical protein